LIDVCGTGGDRSGFFNVSTAVMFVCAGAGAAVVKHGNRSISSRSGGADVLEALGVPLQVPPDQTGDFLARCGFVFLFAPAYHPAFREVAPVRKMLAEQGHLTVFNILGPLLNPARPDFQLAGVFRRELLPTYIEVFRLLGRRAAWAVHGTLPNGAALDEISTLAPTFCRTLVSPDEITLDPGQLLQNPQPTLAQLEGGSPEDNARLLQAILDGSAPAACTDLVCLNAGAALTVCQLAPDWAAGVALARTSLQSGAAAAALAAARSLAS
jgi:anthranilate phosphoribosyltransferase